jgi:hypothetical protein
VNPLHAMQPGAQVQLATRKAALVLHALDAGDRRWMLQRLPPPQRDLVLPLLDELAQLGLPAERVLVEEVLGGIRALHASPVEDGPSLAGASAEDVAVLLEGEPEALVGKLLSLRTWPWKDAFIAQLPAVTRSTSAMRPPVSRHRRGPRPWSLSWRRA